jgi:Fe-Mn family superoxide dismutase
MFTLPKLPYSYEALEPYIDAKTMEIHHQKHHGAYVDNLNKALQQFPQWQDIGLEEIFQRINEIPEEIRLQVRNNGGGHYNHSLFWEIMGPKTKNKLEPKGPLAEAIKKTFGDFKNFKEIFSKTAISRFGSGWGWLSLQKDGSLKVHSTPNQDPPLLEGLTPLLGIDVWEHAYYLKYQNRRAEYVENWWNVVNWDKVEEIYAQSKNSL